MLCGIYGKDLLCGQWAEKFLRDHGAWELTFFRNLMMTPALALDELFIRERKNIINSPAAEQLVREMHSGERGLENCRLQSDIKKPKSAGKDWVSKVDWEVMSRINPSHTKFGVAKLKASEAEIAAARNTDATHETARARLEARSAALDPLNN